ncbi:GntR family transcriptional regulator [Aminobacter sp. BE322]|uniref:GntR family transcriptional regulator n=1 Tax=unclassified Aminobacter TaxID=2644704 RepID=UPI003D1FC91B
MLDDRLEPVASRVTMGDGVYLQLRNALITGRFDPGQALTISALASSFRTSHMPVREALRRLAAENALEVASNGSAKVPQVSVERLDDIYRARAVLEGMATELAAAHVDQGGLAALEAIVADHEATYASGNVYDMLLKNRDFHFAIYRASGSEVLVQLIDTLWLRHGPYMRMLSSEISPRPGSGLQEPLSQHHRVIVEALRKRDGAAARDAMVADIGATQGLLRQLCMAVESSR